ncbi:hypothetical protein HFP89_15525 [Wenzhouxiangella sp. XN79A]|uniref:hypothetical protein n=1 Tax=Wenzhouxiangella sp. XN79A TaxID=2724193 RepID=UPI00144AF553|nr:hypothetical protein [Wenzhouxiangella sp. XN79A]NKI36581.1 hypothetical protein [Wenzhouxiangella sp. XN79A]
MKEQTQRTDSLTFDPEGWLLPFGWFGPVYRVSDVTPGQRRAWSREVSLRVLGATVAVAPVVILVSAISASRYGSAVLFDEPLLFWGLIGLVLLARGLASWFWLRRHRQDLVRVPMRSLGVGARMDVAHGHATALQVGFHAVFMSTAAGMVGVAFFMDAGITTWPWTVGPLAALFAIEAAAALRVWFIRRTRESAEAGERGECESLGR